MNLLNLIKGKKAVRRIGWIIMGQLTESRFYYRIDFNQGGLPLARFRWIADVVNHNNMCGLKYEMYRPWKKYDGLIFLKSMGAKSMRLLSKYRDRGLPTIFDANVNYYESDGKEYYEGMLPTQKQKEEAIEITTTADAVIADSQFIAQKCAQFNSKAVWLPDAVCMKVLPPYKATVITGAKIPVLWSGEAIKLFELLLIEDILLKYAGAIELVLVTNSLDALDRWPPESKKRFESLLKRLTHRVVHFQSIHTMFEIYSRGGLFISPRYLDNTYNLGHTEWKIALAMACGRMVFCNSVPSYEIVRDRANGKGIRVCRDNADWDEAFDAMLSGEIDIEEEEMAARAVIKAHYSSEVIAKAHAGFVNKVMGEAG